MDATAWTVIGAAIAVLVAIATSFRSLRSEMRLFRDHVDKRIERIDAQGEQLRERIDAQGKETSEQIGQLRERMAKLEGLLEAITGKRGSPDTRGVVSVVPGSQSGNNPRRMTMAVKHVPTNEVHSGTKGGRTGCGVDTGANPTHWVSTSDKITCDKNGCKN